jgi:hypothetical protein
MRSAILLASAMLATGQKCVNPDKLTNQHQSHGTINILLANKNGLVALTDSMLTYADGTHPTEPAQKLFRLDDKTICTVAGQYSSDGPKQSQLDLKVADAVRSFEEALKRRPINALEDKLASLAFIIQTEFRVNSLANAIGTSDIELQPLTLTVAGYDGDGTLAIGQTEVHSTGQGYAKTFVTGPGIALSQSERPSPPCETKAASARSDVSSVGDSFTCRIAGISDYVDPILANPGSYKGDSSAIMTFAEYSKRGELSRLNTSQMLKLASALEELTEEGTIREHNHEVGKDKQTAILSNGAITEFETVPKNPIDSRSVARPFVQIMDNARFYGYAGPGLIPSGPKVRVIIINSEFSNFRLLLDGTYYGRNAFHNMRLIVNGTNPFSLNPDNVVDSCDLVLGPRVDYDSPSIQKLIREHTWRYIYRAPQNLETGPYFTLGPAHPAN